MQEIWNPIVGFEGYYEVSNLGRVRGVDRIVGHPKKKGTARRRGVVLSQVNNGTGYFQVTLRRQGTARKEYVHRLVATHFLANRYGLQEVNHIDFNRANNRVENLEWTSRCDNVLHSNAAGRRANKLSLEAVTMIRLARSTGERYTTIARRFGVHPKTARKAALGISWSHIVGEGR